MSNPIFKLYGFYMLSKILRDRINFCLIFEVTYINLYLKTNDIFQFIPRFIATGISRNELLTWIVFGIRSWYLNIQFNVPSYFFKTNFKIDEKFNAKGVQNNGIWNHTAKGCWENKPFLNLPYFTIRFPFTKR